MQADGEGPGLVEVLAQLADGTVGGGGGVVQLVRQAGGEVPSEASFSRCCIITSASATRRLIAEMKRLASVGQPMSTSPGGRLDPQHLGLGHRIPAGDVKAPFGQQRQLAGELARVVHGDHDVAAAHALGNADRPLQHDEQAPRRLAFDEHRVAGAESLAFSPFREAGDLLVGERREHRGFERIGDAVAVPGGAGPAPPASRVSQSAHHRTCAFPGRVRPAC